MIDRLDQSIIDLLKADGRYSYSALAKKLDINVATVTKRINNMLNEETISIKTVLNPFKLGFAIHAFIGLNIDLAKSEQICTQLAENPNINSVATAFGTYDILLLIDFKSWERLHEFISRELPGINGILKIDTYPIIEIKKFYGGLFRFNPVLAEPSSLDKIDHAIIEELNENGRISFAALASKLNISLTTVSRRVSRLRKEGIIAITAIRNPSIMGFLANAYIGIHANNNRISEICAEMATYPETHIIMTAMSGFDILAAVHSTDAKRMYRFIAEKIAQIDGVSNTVTFVCAEIRKRAYAYFDTG
jgi:Lrp/AsnC family transcriptional regulator, regulator for asnA, asnC and gidA